MLYAIIRDTIHEIRDTILILRYALFLFNYILNTIYYILILGRGGEKNMLGIDRSLGIDLGTVSVKIYMKGKGIVLQEPSVVSILRDNGKVLAVGEEAKN